MVIAITPERLSPTLIAVYNQLLEAGLSALHLRLPGASQEEYEQAILGINPEYRSRLIICDYYDLVEQVGLGGIHLSREKLKHWDESWREYGCISASIHSLEEVESLPCTPTYVLAGPVFSSISKAGYGPSQDWLSVRDRLTSLPFPVLALSGVTPDRLPLCLSAGFTGGAVLGYFSEYPERMLERFMAFERPKVLVVAGHDPSTGAGLTADCLSIEQAGGRALSITTCLTSQDESTFESIIPLDPYAWIHPLRLLFKSGDICSAKIGMVSSMEQAVEVAKMLRSASVRWIVWDPILKATAADTTMHTGYGSDVINKMLSLVSLVTPNYEEARRLWGEDLSLDRLRAISKTHETSILLKGGHRPLVEENRLLSSDTLICPDGAVHTMSVPRSKHDKHGTGCKLSSLIATHLARLQSLPRAVQLAQWEVDRYRRSHPSLYGYHLHSSSASRCKMPRSPLMYITDTRDLHGLLRKAEAALEAGVRWVQLRMKNSSSDEKLVAALALRKLIDRYAGAVLIINDDVEVALASNADGVHLGLRDTSPVEARKRLGWGKIIGGTCNTIEDLHKRALEGVDYVGVGPYRTTQTKRVLAPILGQEGMRQLSQYNATLSYPPGMWAIGGIVAEDFSVLSGISLSGIALSGAINHAIDPKQSASMLLDALKRTFY